MAETTTTPAAPGRRRPGRRGPETREAIHEAALELFARLGYHATSMRAIASAAQVQPAAIYHWYPNKEAILVELQDEFMERLTESVRGGDGAPGPAGAEARGRGARARRLPRLHRAAFVTDSEIRALTRAPRNELIAQRDAYQEIFREQIRDGIATARCGPRTPTWPPTRSCSSAPGWRCGSTPRATARRPGRGAARGAGPGLGRAPPRADRRGDQGGGGGRRGGERSSPGAARAGDDRRRRPASLAADPLRDRAGDRGTSRRAATRSSSAPTTARCTATRAGTDAERAADLQWALSEPGIDMVHCARGGYGCAPAVRPDRLGRARRAADRLRLLRHHRPAPGARRARRVGDLLRPQLPPLHPQEGRADRGTEDVVPPGLRAGAARPRVRGPRRPVRAHGRRGGGGGAAGRRLHDPARASSMGTPYEVETEGCVVLVEDLNEDEYLDRHARSTT